MVSALGLVIVSCVNAADDESPSLPAPGGAPNERLQFNRDIRPLLSDRCFLCHGPDQSGPQSMETGLRLDDRDVAVDYEVFDFEDIDNSEILLRIISEDDDQMPPRGSHKQRFNPSEIELIRRWILEGAEYEAHWSYLPVQRPPIPEVRQVEMVYNAIDQFVIAKLESQPPNSMLKSPSAAADRDTLIRRVSLDLTGLPPTLEDVDAFLNDTAPLDQAFETVVDRLLASSAYAEHMTRFWLDAARYADTDGYQYDFKREQWVWRDWVIHAFDTNKRFDEFVIEQIAGDMLEDATDQTQLGTGFNRNHPITIEGGVVDEEYRTEYVADRVDTTTTVFLGQTFLCARCHDHKYDPISQKDFFSFYAFFNNVPEKGFKGFDPRKVIESPLPYEPVERPVEVEKNRSGEKETANQGAEQTEASKFPQTMIMVELPQPRQTFVLDRGEYDKPLKDSPVFPGVPAAFGSFPDDLPKNRLGLGKWLVSRDQPLTARVTVNRFWQQLFGVGLVKTSEDFGSQGEYPSHPDLLDWLSAEFMETGWNVKGIMKTIVMSNTYRQTSVAEAEAIAADPENRLLARGPRFRLDAEAIRDSALSVSGLLLPTVGGPSVYPYHPEGLWLEINNRPNFSSPYPHQMDLSHHHRRTMYSFWKRTVTPPSAGILDAPSREYCVVSRSRTNTPLQAFVLMHDTQFVEAAIHLAARMIREGGNTMDEKIGLGFRLCTSRKPTSEEMNVLRTEYEARLKQYRDHPAASEKVLSVGLAPIDSSLEQSELAAMTQIARILLNLSEFITKG